MFKFQAGRLLTVLRLSLWANFLSWKNAGGPFLLVNLRRHSILKWRFLCSWVACFGSKMDLSKTELFELSGHGKTLRSSWLYSGRSGFGVFIKLQRPRAGNGVAQSAIWKLKLIRSAIPKRGLAVKKELCVHYLSLKRLNLSFIF